MKEKVNEIKSRIKIDLNVDDLNILNDIKTKYIGKKGIITELSSMLKEVPSEERTSFGMMLNEVKTLFALEAIQIRSIGNPMHLA